LDDPSRLRREWFFVVQAIAADFLHGGIGFAKHGEGLHLIGGIDFAYFAHGKTNVDENPVTGDGRVVLKKAEVDFATNTDDINGGEMGMDGIEFDDFSRNG
jgi:hypothetical protein